MNNALTWVCCFLVSIALVCVSVVVSMAILDAAIERALDRAEQRLIKAVPKIVDAAVNHINGVTVEVK